MDRAGWLGHSGIDQVRARTFDGTNWTEAGGSVSGAGGISASRAGAASPSITVDRMRRPVVAWSDGSAPLTQIRAARLEGGSWVPMGGSMTAAGISNTPGESRRPAITIDAAGQPMLVWEDAFDGRLEIYIRRFDGTSWTETDPGSASGGGISNSLASSSGRR